MLKEGKQYAANGNQASCPWQQGDKKKMVAKLLSGLTPLKIVVTAFHNCILLTLLCTLDCNVFQVL